LRSRTKSAPRRLSAAMPPNPTTDLWRQQSPQIIRVNRRVYAAVGYALSNVLYVITNRSVVVIDTTESPAAARACLRDFRKICRLPVSYVIYTHFHGDHIRGASVFCNRFTHVISHERLPAELAQVRLLQPYRSKAATVQFGLSLRREHRGITVAADGEDGYVPPDITFDEYYLFDDGGVKFDLYHTSGESLDHLMVWVPDQQTLFPGDLFYGAFPMLSSPMKPDRPVLEWAESLQRMRGLRPQHLVPSHGIPVSGAPLIDRILANYVEAILFVHDETVRGINEGLSLDQICRRVRLPKRLARLPYLQPFYGTVEWSVRGIFHNYTGWYDFNPAHLRPQPHAALERAIIEASGGTYPLVERARRALHQGMDQLVLGLTQIVLEAQPQHFRAHKLRLRSLSRLGARATNGVERNIYRTAAREALATLARLNHGRAPG
jgi:alkyl sulfatase BDS1-like metallo-beta-lactamase superfamily hydrolase